MRKLESLLLHLLIIGVVALTSCSKDEIIDPSPEQNEQPSPIIEPKAGNPQGVMIQGFYWDVPAGGNWWNTLSGKVSSWANAGITAIWLPPSNKCQSGPNSVGYDPFDYFDFGDYNQMGTTETRYGSRNELTSLISTAHNSGIKVYADIVMNHNGGGASELNYNTGTNTYTDFNPASGMFFRSYNDFHPSTYWGSDEGVFGDYPDLCHHNPYVAGWLWGNSNSVAQYYKNTLGYDGWRFDYVLGYSPEFVRNFANAGGGFSVVELWDGYTSTVQSYIDVTGTSAFDFPLMYTMAEAFNNNNLTALRDWDMLCRTNPNKAVTFVANHDVDMINNKMLAYAFIFTHEGYPCLFYRDYEEWLDKDKINTLIWINKNLASGTTTVLYADNDEYIAKMNGDPGLIVYINNSGSNLSRSVNTNWTNSTIHDFANNWGTDYTTDGSGNTTIYAPANSFSVWSYNGSSGGSSGGSSSLYSSMYLRGSMNSWGTTAMTEVSTNVWETNVDLSGSYDFKFDANGDWATNWGDDNADGIANAGGSNINYNFSGAATIQFNVSSLAYSITSNDDGSSGGSSGSSDATITLRMLKDVTYGYSLYFTGSNDALTNWSGGVEGTWNTGNYWTTTITVPAGESFEFKVRRGITGDTGDTWESGSNHVISSPTDGTTYTVTFNGGF